MEVNGRARTLLYTVAIVSASVLLTFVARHFLDYTFFLFMLFGVVLAALRGGITQGLLATALAAFEYLAVRSFELGWRVFSEEADLATVFITVSLVVSWMAGRRQQALERLGEVVNELHAAAEEVKTLRGLIPICAGCKKIRDEEGYWVGIERYLEEHTDAQMTHGMCKECLKRLYPDLYPQIYPETRQ